MIVICQGCKKPWGIEDCIELSIAGPSHLICRACGADVVPEKVVPAKVDPMTASTIEQRVKQAQGGRP